MKEAMDGPEVWLPPVPWPRAAAAVSHLSMMEANLRIARVEVARLRDELDRKERAFGAGMQDVVLLDRLQGDVREYTAEICRLSTELMKAGHEIGRLSNLNAELRATCKGLSEGQAKIAQKEIELRDREIDRLCLILRAIGKSVEESKAWTRDLPGDEKASQMSKPVTDLELSKRIENCLKTYAREYIGVEIKTLGDLVKRTDAELLCLPSFGRKSLKEMKATLGEMGLHLGMDAPA